MTLPNKARATRSRRDADASCVARPSPPSILKLKQFCNRCSFTLAFSQAAQQHSVSKRSRGLRYRRRDKARLAPTALARPEFWSVEANADKLAISARISQRFATAADTRYRSHPSRVDGPMQTHARTRLGYQSKGARRRGGVVQREPQYNWTRPGWFPNASRHLGGGATVATARSSGLQKATTRRAGRIVHRRRLSDIS